MSYINHIFIFSIRFRRIFSLFSYLLVIEKEYLCTLIFNGYLGISGHQSRVEPIFEVSRFNHVSQTKYTESSNELTLTN